MAHDATEGGHIGGCDEAWRRDSCCTCVNSGLDDAAVTRGGGTSPMTDTGDAVELGCTAVAGLGEPGAEQKAGRPGSLRHPRAGLWTRALRGNRSAQQAGGLCRTPCLPRSCQNKFSAFSRRQTLFGEVLESELERVRFCVTFYVEFVA